MSNKLKNFGIFCAGIAINGYLMHHAVKANNRWNEHLASLSPQEIEKLKAREWFLKSNSIFYGTGNILLDRRELDVYKGKTDKEKEEILTAYRWER